MKKSESLLPECVERVRVAADELYELILNDLIPEPRSPTEDAQVQQWAEDVVAWGDRVHGVYGSLSDADQQLHSSAPTSLLGLMAPPMRRRPQRFFEGPRLARRDTKDGRTERQQLCDFKRGIPTATQTGRSARSPQIEHTSPVTERAPLSVLHAADVLGDVPDNLQRSFASFHPTDLVTHSARVGTRDGTQTICPRLSNFEELSTVVWERHRLIVSQCIALVGWVRDRIMLLEDTFVLRISHEGALPSGRHRLLVSQVLTITEKRGHSIMSRAFRIFRLRAARSPVRGAPRQSTAWYCSAAT